MSAEDLNRAAASIGAQTHQPQLAAYSRDLTYAADISENAQKEAEEIYCATLASVHVRIVLKNPVIHFARELKENRCLEDIQRQHWREHVRADSQAVEEFPFLSKLRDAAGHLQPSRAKSPIAAKTRITAAIHSEIEKLMDQLGQYRASAEQRVDTSEAIEELSSQMQNCS